MLSKKYLKQSTARNNALDYLSSFKKPSEGTDKMTRAEIRTQALRKILDRIRKDIDLHFEQLNRLMTIAREKED